MKTTGKTAHQQYAEWMANPDYAKAYEREFDVRSKKKLARAV